ncbi:MAG TPA: ribosome maturation factor RimM [Devosia sp.]
MGRIGAAHGIKGEVRIQSFTEDPLAIMDYGPLATNKPGLVIEITDARTTTNVLVARIKGFSDRNAVEKLNGVELFIDRDLLPEIEDEDDYYHADLIGLDARLEDGSSIGEVITVPNFGAGDMLEIRDKASGDTRFIPFTKAAVPEVHIAAGYVVVVPPIEIEAEEPGDEDTPDAT